MRNRGWVVVTVILILAVVFAGIGAAALLSGSEDAGDQQSNDPDSNSPEPSDASDPNSSATAGLEGVFELRQVLFQEAGQTLRQPPLRPGPASGGENATRELQRVDCELAPRPMRAQDNVILCDSFGFRYGLGPSELPASPVESAEAGPSQTNESWVVTVQLTPASTAEFEQFTRRVSQLGPPLNQAAIVINGAVVTAPVVNEAIATGLLQISGPLSEQEANALAVSLS